MCLKVSCWDARVSLNKLVFIKCSEQSLENSNHHEVLAPIVISIITVSPISHRTNICTMLAGETQIFCTLINNVIYKKLGKGLRADTLAYSGIDMGFGVMQTWVCIKTLPFISCVFSASAFLSVKWACKTPPQRVIARTIIISIYCQTPISLKRKS